VTVGYSPPSFFLNKTLATAVLLDLSLFVTVGYSPPSFFLNKTLATAVLLDLSSVVVLRVQIAHNRG